MHWSAEPSPLHACITHVHIAAWLTVYACSISGVTTYTAPEQGSGTVLFRVSAWSRSRGKAPGYLNWIMHTACLHYHCIDNRPAKHRMVISHVAEVCHVCIKHRLATQHWATHYGRTILFLHASNVYFLLDDPYQEPRIRTDGREKIAKWLQ